MDRTVTVFGKSASVDVNIDHSYVSRRHFQLRCQDGVYFISDLGSTNGTYLNGERLEPGQQLKSQLEVPAEHVAVHRHPKSILEVRRVLLEQLAELQNFPYGIQVTSFESDVAGTASPTSSPSNVPSPGQDEPTLKRGAGPVRPTTRAPIDYPQPSIV